MYLHHKILMTISALICAAGYAPHLGALDRAESTEISQPGVTVLVENLAPARGTWLTPFWVGFHDGSFDAYDLGSATSTEFERLAEDGNTDLISQQFSLSRAGVAQGIIGNSDPVNDPLPPPLAPGEFSSISFTLDPQASTSRYFSHSCMVVPSNDAFMGNDNPMAHPVFDEAGNFLGVDFIVGGSEVRDAGTESNDELPENTAFFGQVNPNSGNATDGQVMTHPGYLPFGAGGILDDPMFVNADFRKALYNVARILVYNQALPNLTISPTAEISPDGIEIPASGGSFDASFTVSGDPNSETAPLEFNVWIMLTMPDGTQLGPVFGPMAVALQAGESLTFNHTQSIPESYPAGYYLCKTYIGQQYAGAIYGGSYFEFQKLTGPSTDPNSDLRHRVNGIGSGQPGIEIGVANFALLGNKPNPFNPETVIQYALPQASPVRLDLFDGSGRLVQSLVNGWREAGNHEVTFDGSNLASGVYVYRLAAGNSNAAGKMVLLK